jgi:hypothetical protein
VLLERGFCPLMSMLALLLNCDLRFVEVPAAVGARGTAYRVRSQFVCANFEILMPSHAMLTMACINFLCYWDMFLQVCL